MWITSCFFVNLLAPKYTAPLSIRMHFHFLKFKYVLSSCLFLTSNNDSETIGIYTVKQGKKIFAWEREKEGKMIQLFSVKLVGINASGSEGHYFNPETICSECR